MRGSFVCWSLAAVLVAGCDGTSAPPPEPPSPSPWPSEQDEPAVVHLSGTLNAPRTLYRGHVYVIDSRLDVRASLTIQPGAIVKFPPYGQLWGHTGSIVAVGTEAEPIVFTSLADDAHGGDTNGDGAATKPERGTYTIESRVDGSIFERCLILYGGSPPLPPLRMTGPTTLRGSTIAHAAATSTAVLVDQTGTGSVIDSNVFFGNGVPLALSGAATVTGNVFHDPSAAPPYVWPVGNGPNEVHLVPTDPWMNPTTAVFAGVTSLSVRDVPIVARGHVEVPAGGTFTLDGTVLKVGYHLQITVDDATALRLLDGALVTALHDDAHGPPTGPPSSSTSPPAPGDWLGVWSARAAAWIVDARFLYSANSSP